MPEQIESYFRDREALLSFRTAFLAEDVAGMEALLSKVTPEGLPDLQHIIDLQKESIFEESIRSLPINDALAKTVWSLVQEYVKKGGGKELPYEQLPHVELQKISDIVKARSETGANFEAATATIEKVKHELNLEHALYRVGTEEARAGLQRFYDSAVAPLIAAYGIKTRKQGRIIPSAVMHRQFPKIFAAVGTDIPINNLAKIRKLAKQKGYHILVESSGDGLSLCIGAEFK